MKRRQNDPYWNGGVRKITVALPLDLFHTLAEKALELSKVNKGDRAYGYGDIVRAALLEKYPMNTEQQK